VQEGSGELESKSHAPFHLFLGGCLGGWYVFTALFCGPKIGVNVFVLLLLQGQVSMSTLNFKMSEAIQNNIIN
jgi:uncharacterized membrane protein YdcZ (DUF606 family)